MSDICRVVSLSPGGRPIVGFNLENGDTYAKARDSFKITPGQKRRGVSTRERRGGGGRQVTEAQDNGQVGATWRVKGASADVVNQNVEAMLAEAEDPSSGRLLEWRPDGATYSVFFVITGTADWTPNYRWVEYAGARVVLVDISWPVLPLARLLPMDICDPFDVDSRSDYTFDAATSADVAVDLTNKVLTPVVGAALTAERRARHTARGYQVLDHQRTQKYTPGATISGFKGSVTLRASASNTYLEVYVDDNGTNSRLRIDKVIAGSVTNLASVNLAARISNGTPFWVRGRVENNVVYAEHFTTDPTPMGTPTTVAPAGGNGQTLTSAEQAALPAGYGGFAWIPQHASATSDDYRGEPYTYRNLSLPDLIRLLSIPPVAGAGRASALADLVVTPSGGSNAPVFALAAWHERPPAFNWLWNGDFEDDTNGWTTASAAFQGSATSITRITSASKFGTASAQIVCPATADTGVHFTIYRRFKKGVTYTAEFWAQSAAQTTQTQILIEPPGGATDVFFTNQNLSASWQKWSVTFTPTADRDVMLLAAKITAATATTFQIDGGQVYENSTAPTLTTQTEGRGAVPPFGILKAEACDAGDLSGWAITADAGYLGGNGLKVTASGAGSAAAMWLIDPALLVADDFTLGEIAVEVWARADIAAALVSPKLILSARPEAGTSFGQERYSDEWGSTGKLLTKPSSASSFRPVRLGTVNLLVDRQRPIRWKLRLAASWAAGSSGTFGLDYLWLVPARQRALSPTSKANDSTYPKFVASTGETTKTVRSDLSALVAKPPANGYPDHGLGGALLEFPPGDVDVLVKLSNLVPDDPTSDTTGEQLAQNATVHFAVTPRVFLMKG